MHHKLIRTASTHHSLNHLHALVPHLVDGSSNVHQLLLLDLLQHIVNTDEGTSTSNTSTACMDRDDYYIIATGADAGQWCRNWGGGGISGC